MEGALTALVIIDMINEFVDPKGKLFVPGAPATVPRLARVLEACRQAEVIVVHVVRQHCPDGSDVEVVRREVFRRLGGFCLPGSWGVEVVSELAPRQGEIVVIKHGWSAFFETDLDRRLRSLGVQRLVIGGTQTPNCVRATVYDATALGYEVLLLADGTSSVDEAVQAANLRDLAAMGVTIVSCEAFLALLQEEGVGPRPAAPRLQYVAPEEQVLFRDRVLATLRERDPLLDSVLRLPVVSWWARRILGDLFLRRGMPYWLEVDGERAGFLVLRPMRDALRIEALGVLPAFRRRGWGFWLLEQAAAEACRRGLKRLELQVASSNLPALSLYWQAGFRPRPRRWGILSLERYRSEEE